MSYIAICVKWRMWATLVRVRCCLLSVSCLLNPRGYRFLAAIDADKAFFSGHSELYCKPLAVLLFAVSIFGILALLHLFTNLFYLSKLAVYLGKMLLLMYLLRRRKTMMESLRVTYEFDQRLKGLP